MTDPFEVRANCPSCGQSTSASKGSPTPSHQPPGSRATCPGSGSPAV